jgi:hypothetical protein
MGTLKGCIGVSLVSFANTANSRIRELKQAYHENVSSQLRQKGNEEVHWDYSCCFICKFILHAPPKGGGGLYARKLMKYVSVRDSVHILYFWNHSNGFRLHIPAYRGCTQKPVGRMWFSSVCQAARFVGLTLNSLSSHLQTDPSWMFIPLKLPVFMTVMTQTGLLSYETTQSGTWAPLSWMNMLPHSFPWRWIQHVSPKQYSPTDYTEPHPTRPQYKRSHVPQFYVSEIQNFEYVTSFYVMCM